MLRCALIICLVVAFVVPGVAAQEGPSDRVFFGWQEADNTLYAYNPRGETAPLLTLDLTFPPRAWRLSESRALAVLTDTQAGIGVYELSFEGARRLTDGPNVARFLSLDVTLAALSDGYAVLQAVEGAFAVGLLVDLGGGTVELLGGETYAPLDNWRFNAGNVSRLRYLSRNNRESNEWTLRERDLASGEETDLHSFESSFPVISASADGDVWIYRMPGAAGGVTYTRIGPDGSAEPLTITATTPEAVPQRAIYANQRWAYETPCAAECVLTAAPLEAAPDAVGTDYAAPPLPGGPVAFLARPTPERVLVQVESAFWLLQAEGVPIPLGGLDGRLLDGDTRVTDGRWLFAAVPEGLTLFDLSAETPSAPVIPAGDFSGRVATTFTPRGLLVSSFDDPRQTVLYAPGAQTTAQLPHAEGDFYLNPLADGTVLYAQTREAAGRPAGIYRYNPADGVFILVLEGLFPLQLAPGG